MAKYLDMVNINTYDYRGYWDGKTGHHSPIRDKTNKGDDDMDNMMSYYTNKGFAKTQINVGVPLYGQTFQLASPLAAHGLSAATIGPGMPGEFTQQQGMLSYAEICKNVKYNMLTKVAGSNDQGPYAYNTRSGLWVGYDDIKSASLKAAYVRDKGYGGAAIWTLDFDDFNNLCCNGPSPILRAVHRTLQGQSDNVNPNCQRPLPVVTPPPPEFDIWDDGNQAGQGVITTTKQPVQNWTPPTSKRPVQNWTPPTTIKTTTKRTTTRQTTTARPTTKRTTTRRPSGNKPVLGQLTGKACDRTNQKYTKNKENCSSYYRCVRKRWTPKKCAPGLLFDTSTGRCNWGNIVNCGNRKSNIPLFG